MSVSLATKLYGKKPAFFPFTKTVVPNDALPMRRTARGGISAGALHAVRHQRASVLPDAAAGVISGQCPGTGIVCENTAGGTSPCASGAGSACHVPSSETISAYPATAFSSATAHAVTQNELLLTFIWL